MVYEYYELSSDDTPRMISCNCASPAHGCVSRWLSEGQKCLLLFALINLTMPLFYTETKMFVLSLSKNCFVVVIAEVSTKLSKKLLHKCWEKSRPVSFELKKKK